MTWIPDFPVLIQLKGKHADWNFLASDWRSFAKSLWTIFRINNENGYYTEDALDGKTYAELRNSHPTAADTELVRNLYEFLCKRKYYEYEGFKITLLDELDPLDDDSENQGRFVIDRVTCTDCGGPVLVNEETMKSGHYEKS